MIDPKKILRSATLPFRRMVHHSQCAPRAPPMGQDLVLVPPVFLEIGLIQYQPVNPITVEICQTNDFNDFGGLEEICPE